MSINKSKWLQPTSRSLCGSIGSFRFAFPHVLDSISTFQVHLGSNNILELKEVREKLESFLLRSHFLPLEKSGRPFCHSSSGAKQKIGFTLVCTWCKYQKQQQVVITLHIGKFIWSKLEPGIIQEEIRIRRLYKQNCMTRKEIAWPGKRKKKKKNILAETSAWEKESEQKHDMFIWPKSGEKRTCRGIYLKGWPGKW